jgi:serine/threonine protein kinase
VALAPGATFGPYRIIAPLGRGGMASVYRAYEAGPDRDVALKVLPGEFLHDESFAERFRREVRVVARLEHPNIVPIYASGIEQGMPWMAMRLVAGGALSSLVKRGRLEPSRAVAILKGAAEALTYAHEKGVVHRDVKPQNILLDEHERVYLADFGIARMLDGSSKLTQTGMISGTPQYMAPEQATGTTVDARADTYALGIVAYELLTGRVPFAADTPVAILMKHCQEPIPLPAASEVSEPLVRALLKALAKSPEDRWRTTAAFTAALDAALRNEPAPELPSSDGLTEDAWHTVPTRTTVSPTARTARSEPTSPAATAPTTGGSRQAAPVPRSEVVAPTAATSPRSNTALLAAAIGFGGVAALVLAGGLTFWMMGRSSAKGQQPVTPDTMAAAASVVSNRDPMPSPPAPEPSASLPSASVPAASLPSASRPAAPVPTSPPQTVAAAHTVPTVLRSTAGAPPPVAAPPPAGAAASPPVRDRSAEPATVPPPTGAAGPSPAVEALLPALRDRTVEARWKAAEALGNLGEEAAPAVEQLLVGLSDRNDVVRWRTAEALGKIGAAQAAGPLAAALKDRDPLVRTEAAKALGSLGSKAKEAAPALGDALTDPEVYTRRAAAKSLAALGPEARPTVPALIGGLKDKDRFVRLHAAKALGNIGAAAREAVPALTAASRDEEPLVARAAAEALRRIGGDAVPAS